VQALSGTSAAGVYVSLDNTLVSACRAALGLEHADDARLTGRAALRVDCHLPARLTKPKVVDGCAAKTLSESGLTLLAAVPLAVGDTLELVVKLPGERELLVGAVVRWVRAELQLSGLEFTQLDAEKKKLLTAALEALTADRSAASTTGVVTVLVADDDPSIRDFVTRVVRKAGHRVVSAERGDQALALARQERPSLVFLDVLMPGLDGLEVCRALRVDALLGRVPVVLMSAMGEERLAETCREAKANDYLVKPMRLEEVRAAMAKYTKS
jgi:CheY-like chemotaxis protein